jgi:membrane protein involved in D-alanine export
MIPYADLVYFLLVLALVVPIVIASWIGKGTGPLWIMLTTVIMLFVQYGTLLHITPTVVVPELFALVFFGFYQWGLVKLALKVKAMRKAPLLIALSLIPIVVAKYVPSIFPDFHFGFAGISYVTFRSLDVLWSITDGVIVEMSSLDLLAFLFFFPFLHLRLNLAQRNLSGGIMRIGGITGGTAGVFGLLGIRDLLTQQNVVEVVNVHRNHPPIV